MALKRMGKAILIHRGVPDFPKGPRCGVTPRNVSSRRPEREVNRDGPTTAHVASEQAEAAHEHVVRRGPPTPVLLIADRLSKQARMSKGSDSTCIIL